MKVAEKRLSSANAKLVSELKTKQELRQFWQNEVFKFGMKSGDVSSHIGKSRWLIRWETYFYRSATP